MSLWDRVISEKCALCGSFGRRTGLCTPPSEPSDSDNAIILAGIALLLNLYAKKFRCPDVLTSISSAINLCYFILSIPAERNNYDTQASDDCRRQWPEQ